MKIPPWHVRLWPVAAAGEARLARQSRPMVRDPDLRQALEEHLLRRWRLFWLADMALSLGRDSRTVQQLEQDWGLTVGESFDAVAEYASSQGYRT